MIHCSVHKESFLLQVIMGLHIRLNILSLELFLKKCSELRRKPSFHYSPQDILPLLIPWRTVNLIPNIQEVTISPENAAGPLVCLVMVLS